MEKIHFRNIENKKEISNILDYFTPYFKTLKDGIIDKDLYASKILNNGKVIVLEVNETLVGFAAFYCNDDKSCKAYLSFIAINDEYKQKGFGKMLLNEVKEIAFDNGMKSIELEVRKDNAEALAFYKKQGFKRIEEVIDTGYSIKMQSLL